MVHYSSIKEQIDAGKTLEITDAAMRLKALVKLQNDTYLMLNTKSLLAKYKHVLKPYIMKYKIDGIDALKYEYRPTILSYDIYGTIELAPFILYINGMVSACDFYNLDKGVKLFSSSVADVFNEILLMEQREKNRNELDIKADLAKI